MNLCLRYVLPLFCILASAPGAALAQTMWYVDGNGTPPGSGTAQDPYTSIQYAISRTTTVAGDTVLVLHGSYFENLDFLGKGIRVVGQSGAGSTIVDAGHSGSVVSFVSGENFRSVLEGFTIQHGTGTGSGPLAKGGGIYCVGSSPTLVRVVVANNRATLGGGIYLENSSATLSECTIRDNGYGYAGYSRGMGIYADCISSPSATDCTIRDNRYADYGGGVFGPGTYLRCSITGNSGTFGGGGHFGEACDLEFIECDISENVGNTDPGFGGGVFGGTLTDCTISGNSGALQGGGAHQATLLRCVVSNNWATDSTSFFYPDVRGGGTNDCELVDCEVFGNTAGHFDGFYFAAGNGGGVAGGTATNCVIHHNESVVNGACNGCSFESGFGGGGAFAATLTDCDIHHNEVRPMGNPNAFPAGGGLFAGTATRCRIWQNSAEYGGGAADADLESCTVHANLAAFGGGGIAAIVDLNGHPSVVHNSILWSNGASETAEPFNGTLAVSYSDVQGGASGTGNLNVDPLLFAPFSGDFHLKPLSPCIDTGDPASPLDPDNTRIDMGAIPFVPGHCGTPGAYCVAKVNSLGCSPEIGFTGSPSVSGPDDFHVTAALELNRKNGLLFWGRLARNPPYLGGNACVRGALVRTAVQNSGGSAPPAQDCTGSYDFHFSQAYMAAQAIGASDTVYAQWFSRDPAHADGTARNYSDALEFTVCP